MCGPMLRYDTVDLQTQTWLGFCCIVTADNGSTYSPSPMLHMRWTPSFKDAQSMAPHLKANNELEEIYQNVSADKIFVYQGSADSYTFWRFSICIPMGIRESRIHYSINHGAEIAFCVPAVGQNLRWVGYSCNGFSAGVDRESFNGSDPVWNDLLTRHKALPFHVLIGGGDQLYCDAIAKEPEMADWLREKDQIKKKAAVMSASMSIALDRFFFSHYCNWFRSGAFGKAISSIPMMNMLDDHDIIDGFGSYPDDLQRSAVFSTIGSRGYFWYLLFQLFIVDETDGISNQSDHHRSNIHSSLLLGGMGPYIPFRNHSFLTYLGPQVWILLLDCRSERKKDQVCSKETYQVVLDACRALPASVTHLIFLLGIPIAYPRMVFAERVLEKKNSPVFKAAKACGLLPGFYNNFNADPELLDDMNDHWCAQSHKKERNWLVVECQKLAVTNRLRIAFLSGDVHCAAVGRFSSLKGPLKGSLDPAKDPKYMLNVISSAIVNTPPPAALIGVMGLISKKTHKSLHGTHTAEDMLDIFHLDTDGTKLNNPRFMARRNYCAVRFVEETGELEFNLRIEIAQGAGETKGYPVLSPPPLFN
ncbi:hypothetical protein CROQUDRAFT_44351 [Cronartium quercuum f. sp. fusiforme G11]|uniref:PhoD-like phosphatase domain-containing protein n=1 Tax=Cronartium quercuum f. sp. fusiforme G11 TaxID=708437 RepID=A0A9P6NI87_9BASI|nr:hypothetical protein CROQUDRAFT_44351 [Cronartium quercuum f. sp. fusiforme G11]